MDSKEARQDKLQKPHAHFGRTREVIADPSLSKEEKAEALDALEQDARLLTTATQEGMTGGEESKLGKSLMRRRLSRNPQPRRTRPFQAIPLQARAQKWPRR